MCDMKGCFSCMKYLVIIFNLILWLAGVGVLAVAVWLYFNSALYMNGSDHSSTFFTAIYVIIAAGGVMAIVGFLGCCGALRESQCMLGTYFVLLLVIFTAEVTGGVWAYLNKDETKSMIAAHVKTLVYEQYQTDQVARETVDLLQRDLKCCGVESPADWSRVKTGAGEKVDLGIGKILGNVGVYSVPRSCCSSTDVNICDSLRKLAFTGLTFNGIHSEGCSVKLQDYIERHLTVVIGVVIGLAIAQILSLIFSIILCCGIRDSEGNSYKA